VIRAVHLAQHGEKTNPQLTENLIAVIHSLPADAQPLHRAGRLPLHGWARDLPRPTLVIITNDRLGDLLLALISSNVSDPKVCDELEAATLPDDNTGHADELSAGA